MIDHTDEQRLPDIGNFGDRMSVGYDSVTMRQTGSTCTVSTCYVKKDAKNKSIVIKKSVEVINTPNSTGTVFFQERKYECKQEDDSCIIL